MAEKQEGYVAQKRDKEAGHIYFYGDVEHCEWVMKHHRRKLVKATLVVGDERVFTESEVMAMLDEAELLARNMGALVLEIDEAKAMASADIATIKVRHGVSLDPA